MKYTGGVEAATAVHKYTAKCLRSPPGLAIRLNTAILEPPLPPHQADVHNVTSSTTLIDLTESDDAMEVGAGSA
eukprot:1751967-Prorocentrum_lima.AAC.1